MDYYEVANLKEQEKMRVLPREQLRFYVLQVYFMWGWQYMINVIPIPLHMLIHTVEYHEYTGEDDTWGGSSSSFAPPVTLKRVRVQPNEKVYNATTGDSVTFQSILFHDAVNSSPANQTFKEKSKIVWNGKEMFIKEVEPLCTTNPNRPHHTEMYLR